MKGREEILSFLHSLRNYASPVTLTVGVCGVAMFIYLRRRGGGFGGLIPFRRKARRAPVLQGIVATQRPEIATKRAIDHIARDEIVTIGGLVHFFRGPCNEKKIRVGSVLLAYLQRLVVAKRVLAESGPQGFDDSHARGMLRHLCDCSERAGRLEGERATAFDAANPDHERLLRGLWAAAGNPAGEYSQRSERWAAIGFQGVDPTTDLRGGGVLALRQLLHFAETHNAEFREMMAFNKRVMDAKEHTWYLLAVVSIQFTTKLMLQDECSVYLPQLEVLYDTVSIADQKDILGERKGRPVGTGMSAEVRERHRGSGGAASNNNSGINKTKNGNTKLYETHHNVWSKESDFEVGFFALHHQLLLHFKNCWHRDLPHVMEYNRYIPTVFQSFFLP